METTTTIAFIAALTDTDSLGSPGTHQVNPALHVGNSLKLWFD